MWYKIFILEFHDDESYEGIFHTHKKRSRLGSLNCSLCFQFPTWQEWSGRNGRGWMKYATERGCVYWNSNFHQFPLREGKATHHNNKWKQFFIEQGGEPNKRLWINGLNCLSNDSRASRKRSLVWNSTTPGCCYRARSWDCRNMYLQRRCFKLISNMLIFFSCVVLFCLCYNRPTLDEHESSGSDSSSLYCWHASISYLPHLVVPCCVAAIGWQWHSLFCLLLSSTRQTLVDVALDCAKCQAHCYGRLRGSFGVDSQNTYAFRFGCFHNKYMQERNYRVQVALEIWVVFLRKDLSGLESLRETYTEGLDGLKTMSTICLAPIIYLLFFSLCSCQHFSKKRTKREGTRRKSEIIFLHQPLLLCVILTNCLYASLFLWFRFRHPCMQPIELNSGWQTAWSWWWMEQMFVYIFSLNN